MDDYVHENNFRGIYVREYQSLVEISSISIRVFGIIVRLRGFIVHNHLKIRIHNEICDCVSKNLPFVFCQHKHIFLSAKFGFNDQKILKFLGSLERE